MTGYVVFDRMELGGEEARREGGGDDAVGAEKTIAKVEMGAAKAGMNNRKTRK